MCCCNNHIPSPGSPSEQLGGAVPACGVLWTRHQGRTHITSGCQARQDQSSVAQNRCPPCPPVPPPPFCPRCPMVLEMQQWPCCSSGRWCQAPQAMKCLMRLAYTCGGGRTYRAARGRCSGVAEGAVLLGRTRRPATAPWGLAWPRVVVLLFSLQACRTFFFFFFFRSALEGGPGWGAMCARRANAQGPTVALALAAGWWARQCRS